MTLSHFCTCTDVKCKNHPVNHTHGCDLCIRKNLKQGEIPACFFRAVSDDLNQLTEFSFARFSEFYLKHNPKSDS